MRRRLARAALDIFFLRFFDGLGRTSLYGRFLKQTSTGKMASKKTFHLRYKKRKGPKAVREKDGKLYWIHPDNESNKYLVTEENFADAMKRCRHDNGLARNKQPNAHIPGMGAKEARKDPVPHGTPADQYLTKKYFGP